MGRYIVFEGTVGTGKSTQAKKLYEHLAKKYQVLLTREPGGSEIAENIRSVVQATRFEEEMGPVCEAYLYAASRAQTIETIVKPFLEKGGIVISDRSFLSSAAYQGYARGLGIQKVLEINRTALGGVKPDLILYIRMDPAAGLRRTSDRKGDKWEAKTADFFKKVDEGYHELSGLFPGIWVDIDGSRDVETVHKEVVEAVNRILQPS